MARLYHKTWTWSQSFLYIQRPASARNNLKTQFLFRVVNFTTRHHQFDCCNILQKTVSDQGKSSKILEPVSHFSIIKIWNTALNIVMMVITKLFALVQTVASEMNYVIISKAVILKVFLFISWFTKNFTGTQYC